MIQNISPNVQYNTGNYLIIILKNASLEHNFRVVGEELHEFVCPVCKTEIGQTISNCYRGLHSVLLEICN